jgi:hypothetical protein
MRFEFKNIRTVICMQGYPLDYHYFIREIGFWSRNICGSIPINCKINNNELDPYNQQIILYYEEIHGIKLKKNFENGLPASELKTLLKCIYNITRSEDIDSNYIGICKDERISGLISKSNLGKYVVELDKLDIFEKNSIDFPKEENIKDFLFKNVQNYPVCDLHENLKNNIALCSRAKAKYIAEVCLQLSV